MNRMDFLRCLENALPGTRGAGYRFLFPGSAGTV
jgi:hypothetical protein